jgi:hypothetical protein
MKRSFFLYYVYPFKMLSCCPVYCLLTRWCPLAVPFPSSLFTFPSSQETPPLSPPCWLCCFVLNNYLSLFVDVYELSKIDRIICKVLNSFKLQIKFEALNSFKSQIKFAKNVYLRLWLFKIETVKLQIKFAKNVKL